MNLVPLCGHDKEQGHSPFSLLSQSARHAVVYYFFCKKTLYLCLFTFAFVYICIISRRVNEINKSTHVKRNWADGGERDRAWNCFAEHHFIVFDF